MKKSFLIITLVSGSILLSCKKEKQVTGQAGDTPKVTSHENNFAKEFNLTLSGNRLVFKTVDDYRKAVNNPTEATAKKLKLAMNGFTNFKSFLACKSEKRVGSDDSLFNDPYFEALLNPDKIIQIGEFIYRINASSKKVFVLPSEKSSEYTDLVNENTGNSNIRVYSTEDNVLELVENSKTERNAALICGETGIGSDADLAKFSYGGVDNIEALAAYNKYGIYFSLFAKINPSTGSNQFIFDFNGVLGYIHYHVRCGSTADYGTLSSGNSNGNGEQRYQSWQGSTNLSNMFFGFSVRSSSTNAVLSRMVVIRKNW